MKYLKHFKIFESQTSDHWDVYDIFQDLFEEFYYELPEFITKYPNQHDIQLASHKYGQIMISDNFVFGAKCLQVRITDNYRGHTIKPGMFKNFEGLHDEKYSEMLQECHNRVVSLLHPVETIVGSIGKYTIDLDLVYFYEKPNFSRCGEVEIYGSNIGIRLEKLGINLSSNSRHDNGFHSDGSPLYAGDMFYLLGYYDYDFYKVEKISSYNNDTPFVKWVTSEWQSVCKKLKIKEGQKYNRENPKITVAEFMTILKKNQNNYETFKEV